MGDVLVGRGRCSAAQVGDGLYGWRLKALNGRVVGVSVPCYRTEEAALTACQALCLEGAVAIAEHARIAHVHQGVGWVWTVSLTAGRPLARSPRAYERYGTCRKSLGSFVALLEEVAA
ncbi:YegP family protein [Streptacidiphilus fuscans]|uniref:DUF1508 domain-containing protein n=1 Tax=Streptacidiphilus fuscans TaxID=2789292 RepID=A0A931FCS2_9ACTN|nr:hypothetical protein [Streptacidiphilus fuscans]MBF9070022.1 hypothetical protein [Streptacidiphilus fuscans]